MKLFNFALNVSVTGIMLLIAAVTFNVSYFKPVGQAFMAGGYKVAVTDQNQVIDPADAPSLAAAALATPAQPESGDTICIHAVGVITFVHGSCDTSIHVVDYPVGWTTHYFNNPPLQTDVQDYDQATYNPQDEIVSPHRLTATVSLPT